MGKAKVIGMEKPSFWEDPKQHFGKPEDRSGHPDRPKSLRRPEVRLQSPQRLSGGAKIWWGENLGAPRMIFFPRFTRAGFEPCRGCTTPLPCGPVKSTTPLADTTPPHGSNPARSRDGR